MYSVEKDLKNYNLYLFTDTIGYVGRIDKFDNDGNLQETYFVAERKIFGRRVGGFVFIPHYDDTKTAPQVTLGKVWRMFLKQASKLGYSTLLLGQPDAKPWRDSDV